MMSETAQASADGRWQFWIDRGGTFTDIVARRPDGGLVTDKLLSENPGRYADAAVEGMRRLLGLPEGAPIPAEQVQSVKIGTTVATNALLQRRGEPTLLVTTEGLRDVLRIGYQTRPRLFDLEIRLPDMLYDAVAEIAERVAADGTVLTPLDLGAAREALQAAYDRGFRAAAVLFIHGYRYPAHEQAVAALCREIGFTQISASHEVVPLMKMVSRGETTTVDAYLSPVLRRYVDGLIEAMPDVRLMFMQSNGGLADARAFRGKDSIVSGPAGGVVGAARVCAASGFERIIGFDMGGTSTDVTHYNGTFERTTDSVIAGARIRAPMMNIHTVAAGGGSMLFFDGARFRVGPDSAGADPGPAAYRRGGPLTVTDCNVALGRVIPDLFPNVFGPDGNEPLDTAIVAERFAALAAEVNAATGGTRSAEDVAEGFLNIAVQNMARAIKQVSVERGYDVTRYTLCCFGGAGGQHACRVADALGMTSIFIHPLAGVLSAYGIGLADVRVIKQAAVEATLGEALAAGLETTLDRLAAEARADLLAQDVPAGRIAIERAVQLRYAGSNTVLPVAFGDEAAMIAAFEAEYRQRYGFVMGHRDLIVEAVEAEGIGRGETHGAALPAGEADRAALPGAVQPMWVEGRFVEATVVSRHTLGETVVQGPAIVAEATATTVVEPGWQARHDAQGALILTRTVPLPSRIAVGTEVDPVMLEIFNNLFMGIAEQMGQALINTAYSVNIKERLDFSCAVFNADAELVANAPHIPVHLGSMSESVRVVRAANEGRMKPGDAFVLNAPYNGGAHLPDVTVVMPVFDAAGQDILFYVGARGHHADIGGLTPGSMPPDSRTIDDEGVLIDNMRLVDGGVFDEAGLRARLAAATWPARNPDQNVADLKAQVAACQTGANELRKMVALFGLDVVQAYMRHVQDNAEEAVRRVIGRLKDGTFVHEHDNGFRIAVSIRVDHAARSAVIDFTGTSPQLDSNFNAPPAITRAAILFVFRSLVSEDIPLNAGCLVPLDIRIPEGSMLDPRYPAAVVAGNPETSTYVTMALYGALGVVAGSQGTMNNFTFGDDRYQYYETVAGGTGAGPDFDGTDAVHSHMTNSLMTDPEVLEWRFPVRLEEFSIRTGSGGAGRHRGGNGARRRIRFLEPMTVAMLANHRRLPPFGAAGGAPGATGANWIERADGTRTELGATDRSTVGPGDVFVIETPGGGGFGVP
jgi:5-oxoprolinase (ATP-hydrolysing)